MRTAKLLLVAALVSMPACSGAAALDPLAPVPSKVDPRDVASPALRVAWTHTSIDEEEDREVPTHAAAVGERAIFVAYADRLDALDLDGEKLWEARQSSSLAFAPVAFRGGVALASETGWLWMDDAGSASAFVQLGDAVNDALVVPAGLVVVGPQSIHLLALSATNSLSLDWSTVLPGGGRRVAASPEGDALYVTSEDGSVTALQAASGRISWRSTEIEVAALRPAVGRSVYVIDRGGRLHAIRRRDGKHMWGAKELGMRVAGSPVVLDGLVWVPGLDAAAHAFTVGAGSHQYRVPANGRVHLDLATWGPWVIVSPQYGPWVIVQGSKTRVGPADPGAARVLNIASSDDIAVAPAVGAAGVVLIDSSGAIRLLTPQQGATDTSEAQEPTLQ